MTTAKSVDPSRPNYIVVFKEASERNTKTMSTLLKRKGSTYGSSRTTGVSLLEAGDSGVLTRVYEGIGVAVADLSDTQCEALKKRDDVAVVAVNEVRYLPPTIPSLDTGDSNASTFGDRGPDELLRAYLTGLRDAANAGLQFLGNDTSAIPAAAGFTSVLPAATQRVTWGVHAMGVDQLGAPTGRGVKVAVLDTGIDLNHRDMGHRVVEGVTAVSMVSGVSVQDVFGHGTHCAGTIGGPLRSVSGTRYGVAPDADLLVGKVFNNQPRPGATDDDILEGIQWADEQGARIISMSLGSARRAGQPFAAAYEELAVQLRNRATDSILLVAAAGNDSNRPVLTAPVGNPAACPSIMAVAAVDRNLNIARFSCGQVDEIGEVNISAPGVGVFSSTTGDTFAIFDGTSMATPHIAGLAALILQANPTFSAKQVFDQIMSRARPLGNTRDFGAGFARF